MSRLVEVLGYLWECLARLFAGSTGTGTMRAAAFVRFDGAMGAGHLGWAFDYNTSMVDAGAVEDPLGTPSSPTEKMGYWNELTGAPVHAMEKRGYNALRYVELNGNAASAYRVVKWVGTQSYCLFGRNCMDDAYDVLRAYGVDSLPEPSHDILPNEWFARFSGKYSAIESFVWTKSRAPLISQAVLRWT